MEIIKSFIYGIISTFSKNSNMLIITLILLIFYILMKIYYPKFRGFMGEFWVRIELNKLPKDKYIVFNDIMIKNEKGTHQIDHIVLSNYGIFVIEMKNYYGLIKGKEYDNKWCQYLGKNKNYFINPIHQNYGHIKTLSELLNIPEDKFISIICFSNQAKVVVDCKNPVVKVDYLINEIKKYKKEDIDINIKNIENVIMSNNIVDDKIRKQHVKNIHNQIKANDELVNNMICPKCNSKLVEKNGKYGKFIGCSNFPKCNYIKK